MPKRLQVFSAMLALFIFLAGSAFGQEHRYVIIDQDAAGPGGTDMASILVLLQSPTVEPLGITVVTGDAWRDEEVAHTLRLLELVGRTDIPVVPGATFPLLRTQTSTQLWGTDLRQDRLPGRLDPPSQQPRSFRSASLGGRESQHQTAERRCSAFYGADNS